MRIRREVWLAGIAVAVVVICTACSGGKQQATPTTTTLPTAEATAAPTSALSIDGAAYLRAFSAAYAEILVAIRGTTGVLQANFDPKDADKVSQLRAQFRMFSGPYDAIQALSPTPELVELHQSALQELFDYSKYVSSFESFLDTGDRGALATASVYLTKASDEAKLVRDLLQRANQSAPPP